MEEISENFLSFLPRESLWESETDLKSFVIPQLYGNTESIFYSTILNNLYTGFRLLGSIIGS